MRRTSAALAVCLTLASLAAGSPAVARSPRLSLTLLRQTPWTTSDEPQLRIRLRVMNEAAARVGDLTIAIFIGQAIDSREGYETSLTQGPTDAVLAAERPWDTRIEPGSTRSATIAIDLSSLPVVQPDDSAIYPLSIEVRREGSTLGSLLTPAIHIVRAPEAPMGFAWWLELSHEPAFDPQGRLADQGLEAALQPGGGLGAPVAALSVLDEPGARSAGANLVVQPSLLYEVRELTRGYQRADGSRENRRSEVAALARGWLAALRDVAERPRTAIVAMPYAAPPLPAMLASGLEGDLVRQEGSAAATVRQILHVGAAAALRPPGGLIDDATLARAAAAPPAVMLADADEVERPVHPNGFAPPAVATLEGDAGVDLLLPDPSAQALIEDPSVWVDPILGAQSIIGELAAIWREQPVPGPQEDGTPTQLGVALSLPTGIPAPAWAPLLRRLSQAPFLAPMEAEELASYVSPVQEAAELAAPDEISMAATIAEAVPALHTDVDTYASMLVEPTSESDDMHRAIMTSTYYWDDPGAAQPWLSAVADRTNAAFTSTEPEVDQLFTFTSGEGTIPLVMGDPGDTPLRVVVEMRSDRFTFPDGDTREVILREPSQIVRFSVVASGPGQNPIEVAVLSPSGTETSHVTIVVRSTAVNRVALWITIAAAAVLGMRWARRWTRRTQTA